MSDWERPIEVLSSSGVEELRRLQAENAKLRELVLDMWCNGLNDDTPFDVEERIFIQMEELGISTEIR